MSEYTLEELLEAEAEYKRYNFVEAFEPYQWQEDFMGAGKHNSQKLAMCANRIGKTFCGAAEMAYHLTGRYPKWWDGRRFDKPINAWACGKSNITTRDILQLELLGDPYGGSVTLGTGAIPASAIADTVRLPGVPHAFQGASIKHVSGGLSRLSFKSYEMGEEKFMGSSLDFIWLDEEPPHNIFTQCATRTATTRGIVSMTFTPEGGMTPTVDAFLHNIREGQYLIQATWDDAPHIDEKVKEQLLSVYSPQEREMRSRGIPAFGSGPIFPFLDENIEVTPFHIPEHWPRICGIDFGGFDHPTAATWLAWDREADIMYITDEYSQSKQSAIVHAASINSRPKWIPIAWPHDGNQHDKGSGVQVAETYRRQGCNFLPGHFTNPPSITGDNKGALSVEAGVLEMYQRLETGRLKVFTTCFNWLKEKGMYHRKDGKIVPLYDDAISASRYALMSMQRFGMVGDGSHDSYSSYHNFKSSATIGVV